MSENGTPMRRREFLGAAGTTGLLATSGTGLVAATPTLPPGSKEEERFVDLSPSAPSPTSVADSLSSAGDEDCWYYSWEYADPSKVVVELNGPRDADFDLYLNEGRVQCPTIGDYDYRSLSPDGREAIVIDAPDTSTDLYALIYSSGGGGEYALTVTEYR